jgi:YD repeat-containing protein
MQGVFRRVAALIVALVLLAPQSASLSASTRTRAPQTLAAAAPVVRVQVTEPPRVRPSLPPASAIVPRIHPGVRAVGVRVAGPPMLRPSEIDRVLRAARAASSRFGPVHRVPQAIATQRPFPNLGPGARRAQSLPSDPNASGTGINHWWRYQEESVPGGGRVMVNVGTGNLLLQQDDMSVPHKGIAMAFRRTYNSQSLHDVNASDAGRFVYKPPGMYGNGWTSTFDAHIARNADLSVYTVFDIDGARYDYDAAWPASAPNGIFTPRAGNHATLAYDGVCGYLWTKKSGTTYYFYAPGPHAPCPQTGGSTEGYTGRLYQIIGRNRNTYLTLNYSWDGGNASLTGKISQISVQAESGLTATLGFGDVNGHRLLQQLTFPDNVTSVQYAYDASGNLGTVSRPSNNPSGIRPLQSYGYQSFGSGQVMQYAVSPRFNQAAGGYGTDGGYLAFVFGGTSVTSSTVSAIGHGAVVNPTLQDGTNSGVLQPGYPSTPFGYLIEYFTTGVTTPTFRDTDGHMTNWVVDGFGRPTQTQECTASTNQGTQCTGTWLISGESWDADNNLVAEIEPRGFAPGATPQNFETDYAYDIHGNTVAAAAPAPNPGAFRPTRLFSYDAQDNVTAYCDPNATHALSSDWTAPPTAPTPGQGGLCPQSTLATQYQWSTPSYQSYGELVAAISPATSAAPTGYQRTFSYDTGPQGGTDYGLPTRVTGAPITQSIDPTTPTRTPQQSFWYDINGNLICYGTGSGQWLLSYDALGRVLSTADPDDSSSGSGVCGKTGAQAGWNTTSRTAYFDDGSVKLKQSASQVANGVATTFTYDLDGNVTTETHHFGCTSVASCTAGVTTKWYDGADRLVEVQQPYDASDIQQYPWSTRYIYDLSQGGVTAYRGMGLRGYGNLVSTQELLSGAVWTPPLGQTYPISTGTWMDVRATSFDALDRPMSSYEAAFGDQPKATNFYDGPSTAGLLSSVSLATQEQKYFLYDNLGRRTDVRYPNDPTGSVTPAIHEDYDAAGHVTSLSTAVLGAETIAYDATGAVTSVTEPAALGGGTIAYGYYADGMRSSAGYTDTSQSYPNALRYAYRADGKRDRLTLGNGSAFTWAYTAAGRLQTQTDPLTGTTVHPDATYTIGKGQPHFYYPRSLTYGPWTESFDGFGRINAITLPVSPFAYTGSQYDLDDGFAQHTLSAASLTNSPYPSNTAVCLKSTIRNEKFPDDNYPPQPCGASISGPPAAAEVNGLQFNAVGPPGSAPASGSGWTIDARAGMLLHNVATVTRGATGESRGSSYAYDASGRLNQDFEGAFETITNSPSSNPTFTQAWCPTNLITDNNPSITCYSNGSRAKTYDAENRLRTETFTAASGTTYTQTSYGAAAYGRYWADSSGYEQPPNLQAVDYGATGHPMRFTLYHPDWGAPQTETRVWLWDGNDRLLECQLSAGRCQSPTLSMEGLGDYNLAAGAIVRINDRSRNGAVTMVRDTVGFSAWKDQRARMSSSSSAKYAPCSIDGGSDQIGYYPSNVCNPQHNGKLTADGWTLDYETWQGVRSSDLAIGQWNTPDVYTGEVHDPMSQKPFMWNRNNPYQYADPTGYDPGYDPTDYKTGFNGASVVTPSWQRNLNTQGLPYNQEAGKNGAAHGKILGGLSGTAAGALLPGGGKILEVLASAAAGQGLQVAGEKIGGKIGSTIGGYTGQDPGPLDPNVQKAYDWLNVTTWGKVLHDVVKVASQSVGQTAKAASKLIPSPVLK